jgi:hypothetical protein
MSVILYHFEWRLTAAIKKSLNEMEEGEEFL